MSTLPDYLFCENKSALPGAGLILYTKHPYWMGQVIKCNTRAALDAAIRTNNITEWAKPFDYNILIAGCGCLDAFKPSGNAQADADMVAGIYRRMADFYLDEKIKPNLNYYRRYLDK